MPVTYRQLPDEEFEEKLGFMFMDDPEAMPRAGLRTSFVAEDGDRIVGATVLQFAAHGEPWWIDPEYTGRVNFLNLAELMNNTVGKFGGRGYFVFATTEQTAKMCEAGKLKEMPWRVFRKSL